MTMRYYTGENDPTQTVYEVDVAAGKWRIVGAEPGCDRGEGPLIDGGRRFGRKFESVHFRRLELMDDDETGMTFLFPKTAIH